MFCSVSFIAAWQVWKKYKRVLSRWHLFNSSAYIVSYILVTQLLYGGRCYPHVPEGETKALPKLCTALVLEPGWEHRTNFLCPVRSPLDHASPSPCWVVLNTTMTAQQGNLFCCEQLASNWKAVHSTLGSTSHLPGNMFCCLSSDRCLWVSTKPKARELSSQKGCCKSPILLNKVCDKLSALAVGFGFKALSSKRAETIFDISPKNPSGVCCCPKHKLFVNPSKHLS